MRANGDTYLFSSDPVVKLCPSGLKQSTKEQLVLELQEHQPFHYHQLPDPQRQDLTGRQVLVLSTESPCQDSKKLL